MNNVVTRYPGSNRCGMVFMCLLFAVRLIPLRFASAICRFIQSERRCATSRISWRKRTLVLVTATSKIPLWGLSLKARGPLFEMLPRRLDVLPTHPNRRTDSAAIVRTFARWTILVAVVFIVNLCLSVPFQKGNPWRQYVDTIGKHIPLLCLCMFLLLVFLAGFTYVLWSSKRAFDKIERDEANGHLDKIKS